MIPAAAQPLAAEVYRRRAETIRRGLVALTMAEWDALEDPTDEDEVEAFAYRAAGLSVAAQRAMARMLATYVQLAADDTDDGWDEDEVTGEAVRADDGGMAHAWHIPAFSMWQAMGAGVSLVAALAAAREQVAVQARTDLALAQRRAMLELGGALDDVIGYRRVVGESDCDFCVNVSDRIYHSDDLLPLHPNCSCDTVPVMRSGGGGVLDPGAALDGEEPVTTEDEFEAEAAEE